jgi:hypothetical protein
MSLGACLNLKLRILVPMFLDALDYWALARHISRPNDLLVSCFPEPNLHRRHGTVVARNQLRHALLVNWSVDYCVASS